MEDKINVLGTPLKSCCFDPMTGYFRDGHCNTEASDVGVHTVCAVMDEEFLAMSKYLGNDLSTPHAEFGFPGLKPGDRWCLCAARWFEAYQNDCAPWVDLEATHVKTLEIVPLEILAEFDVKNREKNTTV